MALAIGISWNYDIKSRGPYMLDNFLEKLRGTDAFKDYFDEATDTINKAIKSIMGYNWSGLKKYA